MSAAQLKAYLDATGILACNTDAHLRCLEDIGCSWADAVELIEKKELFLSKVYRKRTVYLSSRVYHLLKQCRYQRPMPEPAERLYGLLQGVPGGLETGELRELTQMDQRTLLTAMDFLLEELYITAIGNGHWLNPSWSTYRLWDGGGLGGCFRISAGGGTSQGDSDGVPLLEHAGGGDPASRPMNNQEKTGSRYHLLPVFYTRDPISEMIKVFV